MGRVTDRPDWCRPTQMDEAAERAAVEWETTAVTAAVGREMLRLLETLPPSPGRWPGLREGLGRNAAQCAARTDPAADILWAFWDSAGEVMDLLALRERDPDARWTRFLSGLRDVVATAERDLAAQAQERPN